MNKTPGLIKRLQFTTTDSNSRQVLQEKDGAFSVSIFFYVTILKKHRQIENISIRRTDCKYKRRRIKQTLRWQLILDKPST